VQIIIPMSGQGQRFLDAGYTAPKPLIEVDGYPMIKHVIAMFPGETDFKFICNRRHLHETNMRAVLRACCPTGQIFEIEEHKLGPVFAVEQIRHAITAAPTIVSYCDYYAYWDYAAFKDSMQRTGCAGAIGCYKGFHPHLLLPNLYAGVRVDAHMRMLEIREKYSFTADKMACWQSSGTYYFRSGTLVKQYFRELLERGIECHNEFYVSLVYTLLRRDGLDIVVFEQPFFCQWGTPFDLEIYQSWSRYFRDVAQDDGLVARGSTLWTQEVF
jgi:NDP-sugar pyrophosphorylase family protein